MFLEPHTNEDIDKALQDIKDDNMATSLKDVIGLSPQPAYELTDFIVKLHPYQCTIDQDSELFHKISDTISWVVLKAMDNYPSILDEWHMNDQLKKDPFAIFTGFKNVLEQELLTNVTHLKIQTWKDFKTFNEKLHIGVSLQLDQHYIDNYEDIIAQQMIDAIFKNIQHQFKTTEEQWEVEFPSMCSIIPDQQPMYSTGSPSIQAPNLYFPRSTFYEQ